MRKFFSFFSAFIIVAAGAAVTYRLIITKPVAEQSKPKPKPALVELVEAKSGRVRALLTAMGSVIPAEIITLQPEISGRIIAQNSNLAPGGILKAGEIIARIDPLEYEYIIEQRRADVERALLELTVEEGRGVIAEREWALLESEIAKSESGRDLALRKPHLRKARAALVSAENALERARLNVRRTTIRAPFDAIVQDEFIDIGQLVGPQSKIAILVGTNKFRVKVSIPVSRLAGINLPDESGAGGSSARVTCGAGEGICVERSGRVVRLLGDLDPVGRLARVLVEIADPMALKSKRNPSSIPLFLGSYVRVEIEGRELDNVFTVPRTAIHDNDFVWIMDEKDQLEIRKIKTVWETEENVMINEGLVEGDRIIASRLPLPVPGMKLRDANSD